MVDFPAATTFPHISNEILTMRFFSVLLSHSIVSVA